MAKNANRKMVEVAGSKKVPVEGARKVAPAPADERFEVTLRLRAREELPDPEQLLKASSAPAPQMTHAEFEQRFGARPADFAEVRKFAKEHNLSVVREDAARRSVMLSGTVADFSKAFGVDLDIYEHAEGTYRGRIGSVKVPAHLASIVEGVFGLDNRKIARPRYRIHPEAAPHSGGAHPFNPTDIARLYNFPTGLDGSGQCIGIIELGGGYRPQDLKTYFQKLGLPNPIVIPVGVDGVTNAPVGNPNSADGEVALDIEVVGAIAPRAKVVVYFSKPSGKGFLDALTKAVHDTVNKPSVISISWGGPEQISGSSFQTSFDQVLQAAAMLGITVCVASGDNGAADVGPRAWDGKAHVDFPASSPFALACGGTRLIASQSGIQSESIWNEHFADTSPQAGPEGSFGAGGGGVSGAFPRPDYQKNAGVQASLNPSGFKGRGVPDVSGDGDPATGYNVLVDGHAFPIGGTSAVAPLWAGLIALINQKLAARVGFINPQLYALPSASGALHDITLGDNRVTFQGAANVGYDAGPGWDPCSGLGTPDGTRLMNVLHVNVATVAHVRPAARPGAARPRRKGAARRTGAAQRARAAAQVKPKQGGK